MNNQPVKKRVNRREEALSPEDVAAYLEAHPEFFDGRDDLLLHLTIPHARGPSISLVERQVSLLRERNQSLKSQLDELIATAKQNDAIFVKCRKLVLSMLDAANGKQLLANLEKGLKKEFKCDLCRLYIYGDEEREVNEWVAIRPKAQLKKHVEGLISSRKPVLGLLRDADSQYLFGDAGLELGSTGIFPIRKGRDIALLALGSREASHFQSGMGTLFTDFITDALARLLPLFEYH